MKGAFFFTQLLQEKVGNGKELWAAVEKSRQRLVEVVHSGAAQALHDRVEGERKRSVGRANVYT